jgi:hypothetical protein
MLADSNRVKSCEYFAVSTTNILYGLNKLTLIDEPVWGFSKTNRKKNNEWFRVKVNIKQFKDFSFSLIF